MQKTPDFSRVFSLWLVRDSNFSSLTFFYTQLCSATRIDARNAARPFTVELFEEHLNTIHEAHRFAHPGLDLLAVM
jgi:hypothetical protein